jgi:hypothetical protein
MDYYPILSKVLGSKHFERLWKENRRFSFKLNVNNLDVNFERNIKYFEIKKEVEDALLETMDRLENSIANEAEISSTYDKLYSADENDFVDLNPSDKEEYLYLYYFDDIYGITKNHYKIACDFIREESAFESALDKYDLSKNQLYFKENWIAKYTPLYLKSREDESNYKFVYDSDLKHYKLTELEIKLEEDVFINRQRFKCRFVKVAKEFSIYRFNHILEGKKYSDDD